MDTRTTWPTPRDGLMFGTRELKALRGNLDADDDTLADIAKATGRRFSSVHTRVMRIRAAISRPS